MDQLFGGLYLLGRKIGGGSFGDVHMGINVKTNEEVAIKLESIYAKHSHLAHEYNILRSLSGASERDVGIPRVYWFGKEGDYYAMVMDILGPSLMDLFNFCSRKFTLKTILLLADQLLTRLEYIHKRDIIHRDLKPENILVGLDKKGKENKVYIVDFGLAKRYRDPKTHKHIPCNEKKPLTGTVRYASIWTHLGVEQSRRDDLESLGFVLLYFYKGRLPWQGLKGKTKKRVYKKIAQKKSSWSLEKLWNYVPREFGEYFQYCRSLSFKDEPCYTSLKTMFRQLFALQRYTMENQFDWNVQKTQIIKSIQRSQRIDKYIRTNSIHNSLWRERNNFQNHQQHSYFVAVPAVPCHMAYNMRPASFGLRGFKTIITLAAE